MCVVVVDFEIENGGTYRGECVSLGVAAAADDWAAGAADLAVDHSRPRIIHSWGIGDSSMTNDDVYVVFYRIHMDIGNLGTTNMY